MKDLAVGAGVEWVGNERRDPPAALPVLPLLASQGKIVAAPANRSAVLKKKKEISFLKY